MAWTGLNLTAEGRIVLNKAQLNNKLNFKSIVVGDGNAPTNFSTQKELVNQLYELENLKINVSENECTLTADLPVVDYDYYLREIGIIVTTDNGDKLYAYDNCGDDAQYIVNTTGVERTEKRIRLALVISGVDNITVSTPSILYVDYKDYEETVAELRQTKVNVVGGDISNTIIDFKQADTIENIKTGEKASLILGKISKAIDELMSHLTDKVKHITPDERTLWNTVKNKVDSIPGKGLSTNDYSTAEKNKLSGIEEKANNYVHPSTHSATMIQQDSTHRFVSDDEKTSWTGSLQKAKDYADDTYRQSTGYTDQKIAGLINGAPETLDTLKEVADAIQDNKTVADALTSAVGKKANKTELDTHVDNNNIHITPAERTNWNDANSKKHSHSNKTVLDGITSALVSTWNTVTNKLDKTGDASNTTTSFTTASARSNISTGEKLSVTFGKIAKFFADLKTVAFTGSYIDLNNRPTSLPANGGNAATVNGHNVNADVPANAKFTDTNTTYPFYQKNIDGNFASSFRTETAGTSASGNFFSIIRNNTANVSGSPQYSSGMAWGINDTHGYLITSYNSELAYIGGGNGDKLNWIKQISFAGHTHNYAASSSAGGSASSAVKLDTATSGSATQPVYFSGGKPVACTYTLGKSVPSNAKFTDTNTWRGIQNNLTSDSTSDSLSAAQGKILNETKLLNKTLDSSKSNIDLDAINETGIYHILGRGTVSNVPVNGNGTLFVDKSVGTPNQIFYRDADLLIAYKRIYNSDAKKWGNWNKLSFSDTNTTYSNFIKSGTGAKSGLVPAPSTTAGTTKYLREDGTWQVPPNTNTTYSNGTGIGLSGTTFYNTGVRDVATGNTIGTINVNLNGTTKEIKPKGTDWTKVSGTNCTVYYNAYSVYVAISAQGVNLTEYGSSSKNSTIVVLPTSVVPISSIYLGTISALKSDWTPLDKSVTCNINTNTQGLTLRPAEKLTNVILNYTGIFPRNLFTIK